MTLLSTGMALAALSNRPVWVRYGHFLTWHALVKTDVSVMADLHKPACGWRGGTLALTGTMLVPPADERICNACLEAALRIGGWEPEG